MEARDEVNFGEVLGGRQVSKKIGHVRQRELVRYSNFVEATVTEDQTEATILLGYKNNVGAKRRRRRTDETRREQGLDLLTQGAGFRWSVATKADRRDARIRRELDAMDNFAVRR